MPSKKKSKTTKTTTTKTVEYVNENTMFSETFEMVVEGSLWSTDEDF